MTLNFGLTPLVTDPINFPFSLNPLWGSFPSLPLRPASPKPQDPTECTRPQSPSSEPLRWPPGAVDYGTSAILLPHQVFPASGARLLHNCKLLDDKGHLSCWFILTPLTRCCHHVPTTGQEAQQQVCTVYMLVNWKGGPRTRWLEGSRVLAPPGREGRLGQVQQSGEAVGAGPG